MIDYAYMVSYTTDRGKEFTADEETADSAILVANEVLQAFYRLDDDKLSEQESLWQRVQAEATLLQLEGALTLSGSITEGEVVQQSDSLGTLSSSTTYAEGTTAWTKPRTPYLDALIKPLLKSYGGSGFVVRL